jgi:hypothetical protein
VCINKHACVTMSYSDFLPESKDPKGDQSSTIYCPGVGGNVSAGDEPPCGTVIANDCLVNFQWYAGQGGIPRQCPIISPAAWVGDEFWANDSWGSFYVRAVGITPTVQPNVWGGNVDLLNQQWQKNWYGHDYLQCGTMACVNSRFFLQGPYNGPGAYTACVFDLTVSKTWGTAIWMQPYALNITNVSQSITFVVAGEIIQPGSGSTFWAPPLQSSAEAWPLGPVQANPSVLQGKQFVSAAGWPVTAYSGAWLGPKTSPMIDPAAGPGVPTYFSISGIGKSAFVFTAEIFQPNASTTLSSAFSSLHVTTKSDTACAYLYTMDIATTPNASPQSAFPVQYFLTDQNTLDPSTTPTVWPPSTATSPLLSIYNALPYAVTVTYLDDKNVVQTVVLDPKANPAKPSMSARVQAINTLVSIQGPSATCTIATLGMPMYRQPTNTNIAGSASSRNLLPALPLLGPATCPDHPKVQNFSVPPSSVRPDWWTFNTAPPPAILKATDGSFLASATGWLAASPTQAQIPAGQPGAGLTNINVVLRGAPLLRLFAHGFTQLSNTAYDANPPVGLAYLGSGVGGVVQIAPNGSMVSLSPASPQDTLFMELPCSAKSKDPAAPKALFVTLRVSDILAARPRAPPRNQYNALDVPVTFTAADGSGLPIALIADSGGELTFLVGDTFQCLTKTPPYQNLCAFNFLGKDSTVGYYNSTVPYTLPLSTHVPSMANFVRNICGQPGFAECRDIVGTAQSTCLGAFATVTSAGGNLPTLANSAFSSFTEACTALCSADTGDDDVGIACRDIISITCPTAAGGSEAAAANANPACACALLTTSTVPVSIVAGQPMDYQAFVAWFSKNFSGSGVPALIRDLACWWPACNGSSAALTEFRPCPAEILTCLALVQQVSATNGAQVKVQLKNRCRIEPAPGNPATTPVPSAAAPSAPPPSTQVSALVLVIMLTVVICVIFLACTALMKGR